MYPKVTQKNVPCATRHEACVWLGEELSGKDHFVRSSVLWPVGQSSTLSQGMPLFRQVIANEGRQIEPFFNHV
ncbi:hypothetical protein L596_025624 [Steinernema carpocapsae]|uniref:Uncharacterized protein n=1 Tax=Steinernema carpocapsae TaxID=34508 RepID=A0A4U5M952_STECR|nr:hypothetical protein L596_025624 [Steinernema carpocapsae]